jgi:hypothetical protein
MALARPAIALDPRRFGKRPLFVRDGEPMRATISEDLRLFAITFAAGFLFVSILIG